MRGTGRSATGGPNSTIAVCTASTGVMCNSTLPVNRQWTIASTGITYLAQTTTTSAESASTTPVNIPVVSSTGFAINFVVTIDTVASGVQELEVVTAVPDSTHVTVAKLTNAHLSGVLFATNRVYLNVTVSPNTDTVTQISGSGTLATVKMSHLDSGELSNGQTVNITGSAHFNGFATVTGISTVGGVTQWTFASLLTATDTAGTVQIYTNVVGGEYVQIFGALSTAKPNNNDWRVCFTNAQSPFSGAISDPNCPNNPFVCASGCTGSASGVTFSVVGTSASLPTNKLGASTSVACSSSCGTVEAFIPVIDLGHPAAVNDFSFGQRFENANIDCSHVDSCIGIRNASGNEQSGAIDAKVVGAQACFESYGNTQQNSFQWNALECTASVANYSGCRPGTTGFLLGEAGLRSLSGFTVQLGPCQNITPVAGIFADTQGAMEISDGHSENAQFPVLIGQNAPASSLQVRSLVGAQMGNCASGPTCVSNDGPYQTALVSSAAVGVSGNFATPINGAATDATSVYSFLGIKKSTGSLFTFSDDSVGVATQASAIASNFMDAGGTNSYVTRISSSPTLVSVFPGGLNYFRLVQPKTANYTVLYSDSDSILTNEGAVGAITYTLPTCNASNTGAHYYFEVDAAQQEILFFPQKIRLGGFLTLAGQSITGTTTGARLGAQCLHSTSDGAFEWLITELAPLGGWSINAGPLFGSGATGAATSVALPTASVGANTCTTNGTGGAFPLTVVGVLTTSTISWSFATTPVGVTGYGTGVITNYFWPSAANTISVTQCNTTAGAVTPGAINVNIKVPQ
jgi:hypothetical protein